MFRWGQPPMRLRGLGVRAIRMCLCPSFRESIKCSGHWMVIAHYQTLTLVQFEPLILHTLWICDCVACSRTKQLNWAPNKTTHLSCLVLSKNANSFQLSTCIIIFRNGGIPCRIFTSIIIIMIKRELRAGCRVRNRRIEK
jgi:hypothetical protein